MSSKFARLALAATAALAVSGASTDAALAGAKWKTTPVSAKKCYKRWTTRTGTHKQRVNCKTGRAAAWPLPAPYIRG
jgi:hypothetical protein